MPGRQCPFRRSFRASACRARNAGGLWDLNLQPAPVSRLCMRAEVGGSPARFGGASVWCVYPTNAQSVQCFEANPDIDFGATAGFRKVYRMLMRPLHETARMQGAPLRGRAGCGAARGPPPLPASGSPLPRAASSLPSLSAQARAGRPNTNPSLPDAHSICGISSAYCRACRPLSR
jgi:hypothetical protein